MASITWHKTASVEEIFRSEPYAFEFDQAVFLLEQLQKKALLTQTHNSVSYNLFNAPHIHFEAVSIKSHVTLSMQASPVHKVDFTGVKPILWINFLSIAGVQGPLAQPYTDLLLDRLRNKDTSFRDFLDIFNHRLASMWYGCHNVLKPALNPKPAIESGLGQALLNLSGTPATASQEKLKIVCLSYLTQFWSFNKSLESLKCILHHHFNVPIEIEPFQGEFCNIIDTEQIRIGCGDGARWNRLGENCVLGRSLWHQNAGVNIVIGPLTYDFYNQFMPHFKGEHKSDTHQNSLRYALETLLSTLISPHIKVHIRLKIEKTQQRAMPLKGGAASPLRQHNRLGFNSWLTRAS